MIHRWGVWQSATAKQMLSWLSWLSWQQDIWLRYFDFVQLNHALGTSNQTDKLTLQNGKAQCCTLTVAIVRIEGIHHLVIMRYHPAIFSDLKVELWTVGEALNENLPSIFGVERPCDLVYATTCNGFYNDSFTHFLQSCLSYFYTHEDVKLINIKAQNKIPRVCWIQLFTTPQWFSGSTCLHASFNEKTADLSRTQCSRRTLSASHGHMSKTTLVAQTAMSRGLFIRVGFCPNL